MVFISYSTKNENIANKINNTLKQYGFKTWFAQESVLAGQSYAKDIVNAIQSSSCLLLLYSSNSDSSVHVQKELDLALKYQKKIYPLRIENIEPKEAMEYFLSGSQYIDIFNDFNLEFNKFIEYLKEELGIKEDFTKKLNNKNIKLFAVQHFKEMGYKIVSTNQTIWESIPEISNVLKNNLNNHDKILTYLSENCFYITNESKSLIVAPLYLDSSSVPYLKAYEADIFWKARYLLWYEEDLINCLKSLGQNEKLIDEEDIEFKLKSTIADRFRSLDRTRKKINILYYLFIKNPPLYKSIKYNMPLKGIYEDNEQMPNLYLNYTFMPTWWGHEKDDIEGIPGKRYVGFCDAYEKVKFENFKKSARIEYEHYDGRIAETLAEVFLKRNDLVVQRFGAESLLGNSISFMERATVLESSIAENTIRRFMTSPDLLVIKLNDDNEIINSYMMDVKFRSYKNKQTFIKQISTNGELYSQAKKYNKNWDSVYLFLFLHLKDEKDVELYFLSVEEILKDNFAPIKIENDEIFEWLDNSEIANLYKQSKQFWV